MKKSFFAILLSLIVVSMLAPASVARADSPHVRLGERFNLFASSPIEYQAGQPFHFAHGWFDDKAMGRFDFVLEVDGKVAQKSFVERSGSANGVLFIWVYNFVDGLPAGSHIFTGHWMGQCKLLLEQGIISGPCTNSGEQVESFSTSMTVEFIP